MILMEASSRSRNARIGRSSRWLKPRPQAAIHFFPSGAIKWLAPNGTHFEQSECHWTNACGSWCYLFYPPMFWMVGNHFGIKIRQPTSKAKQDASKTAPAARSFASRMLGCGSMVIASQAFSRAEFKASLMSTIADAKRMETHSRVDKEEKSPRRTDATNAVS
jgi:hypothetical protein